MAGCCLSLAGIVRDCEPNVGGIKRVWIACKDQVTTVTISDSMITALAPVNIWHEYEFRPYTGNFTSTFTNDVTIGSTYWENSIVLQFTRLETAKKIEIEMLAQSDVVVIVLDNNGKYWYFGYDNPVYLTEGTAETGTALADFNGYNLTLTSTERYHPFEVTEAAMEPIINPTEMITG